MYRSIVDFSTASQLRSTDQHERACRFLILYLDMIYDPFLSSGTSGFVICKLDVKLYTTSFEDAESRL
jgi:hypothetical protein